MALQDTFKEIDAKVPMEVNGIGEDGFNTEDQLAAAEILIEHWPEDFSQLGEWYDFSRQHYANVCKGFFGPPDDDLTFDEITDRFGSVDRYLDVRDELAAGEIPDGPIPPGVEELADDYAEQVRSAFLAGYRIGSLETGRYPAGQ